MNKLNGKNQTEEREAIRRAVIKGVDEIRSGKSTVYNSAEELAEAIINRGKTRRVKKTND